MIEVDKAEPSRLAERLHALIATAAPDCDCRDKVDSALQQFVDQEQHRMDRLHLVEARQHRAAVSALVDLLGDIEELSSCESDRSVFAEMAHLFDDIAVQAKLGADALRRLQDR